MGVLAWIFATLGTICAAIGVGTLWFGPLGFDVRFTWPFWMTLAPILLLLSIVCLLAHQHNSRD
jgi:hypothetical protein